jgi:hypothetical protein
VSRVLPKKIEVLVVSFGGVGTTSLIKYISKYKKTNDCDDYDGYKHLSIPPVSFNKNIKVLYVYGDPILACNSLFRRGFHRAQSIKLQKYSSNKKGRINTKETIEDYANKGIDKLFFEQHFNNWFCNYSLNPSMFIRFDDMWENVDKIVEFLELPIDAVKCFPEKKERNSSYSALDITLLKDLEKMYLPFASRLQSFPTVKVVENQQEGSAVFTLNFLVAISLGAWDNVFFKLRKFTYDKFPKLAIYIKNIKSK